jgi:ABC-type transport system substrate-binding protein
MAKGYWSRTLAHRLSRRRALAGAATLGAGAMAASLIACGGDNEGGQDDAGSGIVNKPVDTTRQAVKGGTMQYFQTAEALHMDPTNGTNLVFAHTVHAYSRLLRYKVGTVFDLPTGEVEADGASSWEISGDGLTVTMKIRPNLKFDQRPPTNSRPVNSADVKYSYDRFTRLHPDRGELLNSVDPNSPVETMTTPDSSTVVFKLAFPLGAILAQLADSWLISIVPVEAEDKYDLKQEMRGTGPWMLMKYTPSVGWEYQRNPNWWGAAERPFLDGINYTLMPEAASRLAQFKAKRLWFYTPSGDQVALVKRESPDILLTSNSPLAGQRGATALALSKLESSPFQQDVRLRQAISMLIDRDGWLEAIYNVSGLEREGLPMETGWHSHIPCSWPTVWLDPKQNKVGEGSKYFHFNQNEAAALLRAAGKFGMETEFSWPSSGGGLSSETGLKQAEIFVAMLQEGGHFKLKRQDGHYGNWYQPNYLRKRAQVDGIYYVPGGGGADIDLALWGR